MYLNCKMKCFQNLALLSFFGMTSFFIEDAEHLRPTRAWKENRAGQHAITRALSPTAGLTDRGIFIQNIYQFFCIVIFALFNYGMSVIQ